MYFKYFDQLGIHDVQNPKFLVHNGTQYDATLFVDKSEIAKQVFQDKETYYVRDNVPEQIFETFFYLAIGQITTNYHIDFLPDILELARTWRCNGIESTIENQLIDFRNPNLILHVLLICPNASFNNLYQFISTNLSDFLKDPLFFQLPVSSLGRIFYSNFGESESNSEYQYRKILTPAGPNLQGYKFKDHVLQLIQTKRDNDQKIEIAKQNETSRIEKLKKRNEELISEKNRLVNQRTSVNKELESIIPKIEARRKQMAELEYKLHNSTKNEETIRNEIAQIKREISQRDQSSKPRDSRKRNRQNRK